MSENPLSELDIALAANDIRAASNILFGLAMWGEGEDDRALAYQVCLKCLDSEDVLLRANAIQSLGHMARVYGLLDEKMKEVIERALADPDENIRTQADSAAMDVSAYLKWKIKGWSAERYGMS